MLMSFKLGRQFEDGRQEYVGKVTLDADDPWRSMGRYETAETVTVLAIREDQPEYAGVCDWASLMEAASSD